MDDATKTTSTTPATMKALSCDQGEDEPSEGMLFSWAAASGMVLVAARTQFVRDNCPSTCYPMLAGNSWPALNRVIRSMVAASGTNLRIDCPVSPNQLGVLREVKDSFRYMSCNRMLRSFAGPRLPVVADHLHFVRRHVRVAILVPPPAPQCRTTECIHCTWCAQCLHCPISESVVTRLCSCRRNRGSPNGIIRLGDAIVGRRIDVTAKRCDAILHKLHNGIFCLCATFCNAITCKGWPISFCGTESTWCSLESKEVEIHVGKPTRIRKEQFCHVARKLVAMHVLRQVCLCQPRDDLPCKQWVQHISSLA